MFGVKIGISVAKYAWHNRKGIMRAYHHYVKHKVALDDLLDLAEEHPDHPKRKEERVNHV